MISHRFSRVRRDDMFAKQPRELRTSRHPLRWNKLLAGVLFLILILLGGKTISEESDSSQLINRITVITIDNATPQERISFELKGAMPIRYSAGMLPPVEPGGPHYFYLHIKDAHTVINKGRAFSKQLESPFVTRIRIAQYKLEPPRVRVVFSVPDSTTIPLIEEQDNSLHIVFEQSNFGSIATLEVAPASNQKTPTSPQQVQKSKPQRGEQPLSEVTESLRTDGTASTTQKLLETSTITPQSLNSSLDIEVIRSEDRLKEVIAEVNRVRADSRIKIVVFTLKYHKADILQEVIQKFLTPEGIVAADTWTNSLVVKDTAEGIYDAQLIIERLDINTAAESELQKLVGRVVGRVLASGPSVIKLEYPNAPLNYISLYVQLKKLADGTEIPDEEIAQIIGSLEPGTEIWAKWRRVDEKMWITAIKVLE